MSNYLRVGGQDMTPEEYQETIRQATQAVSDYGAFQNRLNYLSQLNEYKNAYAAAANDAQKQAAAHEGAEALRKAAAENGVDVSVADNMNANQLQGYRQGYENEAKAKFLYRKTPEQLNAERTQFWLQNGANEKEAIRRAYYDTLPYAAQYSAEGKMLFGDRGTTDNTINSKVGVPLMMLMNDTDPEITKIAAAMFAHPADERQQDQKIRQMNVAGDIARRNSAQGYQQQKDLLKTKQSWQSGENTKNRELQRFNIDTNKAVRMAQIQANYDAIMAKLKAITNPDTTDPNTTDKSGNSQPLTKKAQELFQIVRNYIDAIQKSEKNEENRESTGDTSEMLWNELKKAYGGGKISPQEYDKLSTAIWNGDDLRQFKWTGKHLTDKYEKWASEQNTSGSN